MQKHWRGGVTRRTYKGVDELKLQEKTGGYLYIHLWKQGKQKPMRVSRLVMMAFDPVTNPDELQVNHINHDRQDNRLVNLEWSTQSENMKAAYANGRPCPFTREAREARRQRDES